jgi:hypothetical protein
METANRIGNSAFSRQGRRESTGAADCVEIQNQQLIKKFLPRGCLSKSLGHDENPWMPARPEKPPEGGSTRSGMTSLLEWLPPEKPPKDSSIRSHVPDTRLQAHSGKT